MTQHSGTQADATSAETTDTAAAAQAAPQNERSAEPSATSEGTAVVHAQAAASEGDAPDATGDEGEEEGGDDSSEAGEGAAAADGAKTGEGKKKRRRRRKKKGAAPALAADGTPLPVAEGTEGAEGAAAAPREKQNRPKKAERERPPFNVGDIVFGKVLEVTDDVLFIDLSGKAKGIFDLRELLIPEEEARKAAAAASEEAAQVALEEGATATGTPDDAALAETTEVAVPTTGEQAEPAQGAEGDAAAAGTEEPVPQPVLPRVILEPGAQFVGVVHNDGGRGGCVVVTHHPDRVSRTKPMVAQAHKDGTLVYGIVTGAIKGGAEVDIDGLRAFAPASHMDLRLGADLSALVGKRLPFAVTEYGKRGRDVVLSRKAMLEAEAREHREALMKTLQVGAEMDGVVRTVVSFGAFIDIGGAEGLVPLPEMSHNRADQPHDVFKVGETVRVKLQKIDERGKIWLSRKAVIEDPWAGIAQKYAVGTKHTGKVVRHHPVGVFIELEPAVDGLLRRVDLSLRSVDDPTTIVKEGDSIEVVVAHVDSGARRISLHRALEGAQAEEAPQKVVVNKSVKCVVFATEANGILVRILGVTGWHARGYISGAATGTPRGTELRKLFPVGKELEAKVLEIDTKHNEVRLSIKALSDDTERNAYQNYRQQVKREAKFGTFADLLQKHVAGAGNKRENS